MWSFEIQNIHTKERDIICGYSWTDAVRRAGIDPDDWTEIRRDYED